MALLEKNTFFFLADAGNIGPSHLRAVEDWVDGLLSWQKHKYLPNIFARPDIA